MAILDWEELLELVTSSPEYLAHWELGVSANRALAIHFADRSEARSSTTDVLQLINGKELLLDRNDAGVVVSLEIV